MRTLISLTLLFLYSCQMITVNQLPCIFGEWVVVRYDHTTDHAPIAFLAYFENGVEVVYNKNNSATVTSKDGKKQTTSFEYSDTGICFVTDTSKICSKRLHVETDTMWIEFDHFSLRFQRPEAQILIN